MKDYNVALWFAKNENSETVTVDKLNEDYKGKYYCPLCGSEVIPKAMDSDCVSPHFAHIDRSKCSGESMIHWWVKNELIKVDCIFEVTTIETKQYMCKSIDFEISYDTPNGKYKPDITVTTYCGETIFVEVNFTSNKKAEEYWNKWEYLNNTIVEFNIKDLYCEDGNKIKVSNIYRAIYYKGKEFDISSKDFEKYKNRIFKEVPQELKERLLSMEWFINDIYRYNILNLNDISEIANSFIGLAKDRENINILERLYRNSRCQNTIKEILEYRDNFTEDILKHCENNLNVVAKIQSHQRLICDKIKNNIICVKRFVELDNPTEMEIFKIFTRSYDYFNSFFINTMEEYDNPFEDFRTKYCIYTNVEIENFNDKQIYIDNIKNDKYKNEYIKKLIKDVIKLEDLVVEFTPYGEIKFVSQWVKDTLNSKNNPISILIANNKKYENINKFINDNINQYEYAHIIDICIKDIDLGLYLYELDNRKQLNLLDLFQDTILKFNGIYKSFNENIIKLKKLGFEYYERGFEKFIEDKNTEDFIMKQLAVSGLFINYNNYGKNGYRWSNSHWVYKEIKCILMDYHHNNEGELSTEVLDLPFVLTKQNKYKEVLSNMGKIQEISKKCEAIYKVYQMLFNCIKPYTTKDIHIGNILFEEINDGEDAEFISVEVKNGYLLTVRKSGIEVNDVRIVGINDIFDTNELSPKIWTVLNILYGHNPCISDNIVDIYNKLDNIYKNKTSRKYYMTVVNWVSGEMIVKFEGIKGDFAINENSCYGDVLQKSSKIIRNHLYGGDN